MAGADRHFESDKDAQRYREGSILKPLKPKALYNVDILPLGHYRRLFEKHFFQRAQMAFVKHNQDY